MPVFFSEENYIAFLKAIDYWMAPVADILAWCLMPNHFHLIIHPKEAGCQTIPGNPNAALQRFSYNIGQMLSRYTQMVNKERGTTGSMFRSKTQAKPIKEAFEALTREFPDQHYLIVAMRYLHRNPVDAGLVVRMEDWAFSSFLDYCGTRGGRLCNMEMLLDLILGGRLCPE